MASGNERDQLLAIRLGLKFTQSTMANQLGMSLRAYQALESGDSAVRPIHILAAEQVALLIASLKGNPFLLPKDLRDEVRRVAQMLDAPALIFPPGSQAAFKANGIEETEKLISGATLGVTIVYDTMGLQVTGDQIP